MDAKPPLSELRQQAAAWVVRLSDPQCPADDRAAFERWRALSARHDAAYEREAAAWETFDRLSALRPEAAEPDPDLLSRFASPASLHLSRPRKIGIFRRRPSVPAETPPIRGGWGKPARRLAAVVTVIAFVIVGIGGWGILSTPAYATGIGERRTVVLPDNSTVELNTDSKITVHYGRHTREVTLVRGEAMFDVHQDARPFHVHTREAELNAQTARLNVRLRPEGTAVTIDSGIVDAVPASTPADHLTAGTEALYGPAGHSAHQVSAKELDRSMAWRKDMIELDGQSLAEAVAEFNRYNVRHIVIADPSIATLRLGGYFNTTDIDGFIRALRVTFPIKTGTDTNGATTLMRGD